MTLEQLEAERKRVRSRYRWIRNMGAIPIILAFGYLIFINNPSGLKVSEFDFMHYLILPTIPLIGYLFGVGLADRMCKKETENYITLVYDNFTKSVYNEHFENLSFREDPLHRHTVYDTELIKAGSSYESYDNVAGTYNGTSFKRSALIVQQYDASSDYGSMTSIFNGRWIQILDLNTNVEEIYIVSKKLKTGNIRDTMFRKSEYIKHKTNINKFDDYFEIYLKRETDKYVLSPELIQSILNIEYDKALGILITKNIVYAAVGGGTNNLSPSIFQSIYDDAQQNINKEITLIKQLVEMFTL